MPSDAPDRPATGILRPSASPSLGSCRCSVLPRSATSPTCSDPADQEARAELRRSTRNTVRRIVKSAARRVGRATSLEVGPGLGSLTLGLLEAGASGHRRRDRLVGLAAQLPIPSRRAEPRMPRSPSITERRAARHDLPGDPDGLRRQSAVQRVGSRAAAFLETSLDRPRARHGAGRGGATASPPAPGSKVYGVPSSRRPGTGTSRRPAT